MKIMMIAALMFVGCGPDQVWDSDGDGLVYGDIGPGPGVRAETDQDADNYTVDCSSKDDEGNPREFGKCWKRYAADAGD